VICNQSLEIHNESRERRRECLYYLALGHYKVGEYRKAKEHNNQLLQLEPNNQQALSLAEVIDEKVNRGRTFSFNTLFLYLDSDIVIPC